jgi:CDP-paratose 2-epimerase
MRILVTGGAGFVGSNLAVRMRETFAGATVVAMDSLYRRGSELTLPRLRRHGVRFHHGDVRDPATFPGEGFDFLVECSAEPSVLAGLSGSPDYLVQTNLIGAYHCLERARAWKAAFLFLSSSRVYPIAALEAHPWREEATRFVWADNGARGIASQGVTEDMAMAGARSLYGWSKYSAEQLVEEYRSAFGLQGLVNRCGMISGPWQFGKVDQGVVSLWVQAHVFGRPLQYIGYGGAGKQVRDVLHVHDLADLVMEQLKDFPHWDGWLGNVAGGVENSASLMELTRLCEDVTGRRTSISSSLAVRPADLRIFLGDCRRLYARTSWRPSRTVAKVVADLSSWVLEERGLLEALQ